MKSKIATTLGSVALLSMVSSAVFGYVLLNPARKWFSVPLVRVDNSGLASVNDGSNGTNAAVGAVGAWNTGGITVTNGQAGNVAYNHTDGISDIIFADPQNLCTGSCIAATLVGYYTTSQTGSCGTLNVVKINDADVSFNLAFNYTTAAENDGCSNEIYLEAVTTHEVGHVIGLGHSSVSSALMAPTVSYCVNKPLATDDFNGRNVLYSCSGGGGCTATGGTCTSNGQCCSNNCKGKPGAKTCK